MEAVEAERSEPDRLFRAFARHGDARALGEVYDRLAPELLRLALHTTRDAAEAEDVLQATFVAAMERAASFEVEQRVLPWLVGILANEARKSRARARRRPDPARLAPEPAADPALEAERAELLASLDVALARVPAAFRPVLQLRLRHGLSLPEIAAALERPPGTVRSQLVRGTEVLRRALPAGLAGAFLVLVPPTRGLAAVRQAVLEHGALLRGPLTDGPLTDGPLIRGPLTFSAACGGILAMKKLVAVALVFAAGLWLWERERGARAPAAGMEPRARDDGTSGALPALERG